MSRTPLILRVLDKAGHHSASQSASGTFGSGFVQAGPTTGSANGFGTNGGFGQQATQQASNLFVSYAPDRSHPSRSGSRLRETIISADMIAMAFAVEK